MTTLDPLDPVPASDDDALAGPVSDTPAGPRSILDELRARREQVAAEQAAELVLDVPNYEGKLAVRFRYPEGGYKTIVGAIERAQTSKDPDALLNGNCDAIIACCDEILGRRGDGLMRLDEHDDRPLRFTPRLAELFGIPLPESETGRSIPRHIVRHVFSPRAQTTGVFDGDVALMATAGRLVTWLQTAGEDASESFAGES